MVVFHFFYKFTPYNAHALIGAILNEGGNYEKSIYPSGKRQSSRGF